MRVELAAPVAEVALSRVALGLLLCRFCLGSADPELKLVEALAASAAAEASVSEAVAVGPAAWWSTAWWPAVVASGVTGDPRVSIGRLDQGDLVHQTSQCLAESVGGVPQMCVELAESVAVVAFNRVAFGLLICRLGLGCADPELELVEALSEGVCLDACALSVAPAAAGAWGRRAWHVCGEAV